MNYFEKILFARPILKIFKKIQRIDALVTKIQEGKNKNEDRCYYTAVSTGNSSFFGKRIVTER